MNSELLKHSDSETCRKLNLFLLCFEQNRTKYKQKREKKHVKHKPATKKQKRKKYTELRTNCVMNVCSGRKYCLFMRPDIWHFKSNNDFSIKCLTNTAHAVHFCCCCCIQRASTKRKQKEKNRTKF